MSHDRQSETARPEFVYIVLGRSGEYSDRVEWVAGVYDDKSIAIELATCKLREARAYAHAYTAWCQQAYARGLSSPASPENREAVAAVLGPMPEGDSADDFTVIEAVKNTWGRWETVHDAG